MWTPGIIGLVIGVLLLFSIKDDPETAGYPPIDEPAKSEQRPGALHHQHTRTDHCASVPPSRYPVHAALALPDTRCTLSVVARHPLVEASIRPLSQVLIRGCPTGGVAAKPKAKDERSLVTILVEECLKSRAVWLFAISYFL